MASTGLDVFDTTVEKTNKILIELEQRLGWQGRRHQTYHAMRIVLHTLRDRLPVEDAVNLSAQFPILIKGIFFDGWKPEENPVRMNREEFVNRIRNELMLDVEGGIEKLIRIILDTIFNSIDPMEREKIILSLPGEIADLVYEEA